MKQIDIKTEKGYDITAKIFEAEKSAVLVIASATGVKQGYYKKFSEFISLKGITVITFDYSGIGLSLKQPIKQIKSNVSDWGKNDLEAVIQYARAKYPNAKITILGHSIGGQIIGLAKSSSTVQKVILVCAQSGYWKLWNGFGKVKMWANWHILFPILINVFGYFPSKKFSGMEDLPKNVAKQWSSWGRKKNYLFDEISEQDLYFNEVTAKTTAISIANDHLAPKEAVEYLTNKYINSTIENIHLIPNNYNVKDIGHFGVFREKFQSSLWEILFNQIEK
jgi:predicted alpha/beta hydrolase